MNNAYNEPGLTSGVLSDLAKIPTKDFEEKFREWMERDDVTRSLQAKLRCDLITNFNKTALGRQIMSQTTMTTSGVYGGGKTQRLTLSPVVLALNTLVAEFLYAENCHYTLSVFCTEVPYRNTLPDFDERSNFRFATNELHDLLAALAGSKAAEQQLSDHIKPKYTTTNTSLLFLLLQFLLANLSSKDLPKRSEHKFTMTTTNQTSTSSAAYKTSKSSKSLSCNKDEMYQLNKYLYMLSRRMEKMMQQFETMQKNNAHWKVKRPKKQRVFSRSLERMTKKLKKMSQDKIYNKQMQSILTAISHLGNQFENCANNFAQFFDDCKSKDEPIVQPSKYNSIMQTQKQSSTQTEDKTYADWLREMCQTRNGKKFLNKIDQSLTKALKIQKTELEAELNGKFEQQKTLLKIRYKKKLIDHIAQHSATPTDELFTELQKQLKDLQLEYNKLMEKLQALQQNQNSKTEDLTVEQQNIPVACGNKPINNAKKAAMHEMEHIHSIMENLQLREPCADNLLQDAKKRLMALDEESNQIEKEVSTCLARFSKQTKATGLELLKMDKASSTQNHKTENSTQTQQVDIETQLTSQLKIVELESIEISDEEEEEQENLPTKFKHENHIKNISSEEDEKLTFENAITNAKKKFFENEEKRKQHILEMEIQLTKAENLSNKRVNTETYHDEAPQYSRTTLYAQRFQTVHDQTIVKEHMQTFIAGKSNAITIPHDTDETLSTESTQHMHIKINKTADKLNRIFTATKSNVTFDMSPHRDKSKQQQDDKVS